MLRDARLLPARRSGSAKFATLGLLTATALLVAGLRGPTARAGNQQASDETKSNKTEATAQTAPAQPNPADAAPLDLSHVPQDAVMVIAGRPAAILAQVNSPELNQWLQKEKIFEKPFGIGPDAVRQITLVVFRPPASPADRPRDPTPEFGGVIVHTKTAPQLEMLFACLMPEPTPRRYAGRYFAQELQQMLYAYQPDETTLVISDAESKLFRLMDARPDDSNRAAWSEAWKTVRDAQLAVALDVTWLRQAIAAAGRNSVQPQVAIFAPLWEQTRSAAVGVSLKDGVRLDGIAVCNDADGAKQVRQTADAALTLGRNLLNQAMQQMGREREPTPQEALHTAALRGMTLGQKLFDSAKLEQQDATVRLHAEIEGDGAAAVVAGFVIPAVAAARGEARRMQAQNNLKQIGLAMHNYADQYGHFPPAVVLGPDGKTPHSWRVELLPFLEEQELYKQYRMNEPWDSPNNRKVLAQLPPVFRDPSEPAGSTSASYYVLTSAKALPEVHAQPIGAPPGSAPLGGAADIPTDPQALTLFSNQPRKNGPAFAQITDGLSNTLLAVEADRDVPWTRPEDIPFDPDKPLAGLGGYYDNGFNVLFADGAVSMILHSIDGGGVPRVMVTPAGGEFPKVIPDGPTAPARP